MIKGYTNDLQSGELEHTLTDAYWLRVFAGQSMQGMIISDVAGTLDDLTYDSVRYAKALLVEIKRKETENDQAR